jgi:hypothetical protein
MSKGGENERKIAKYLTKWLTGKPKPYMFWRQDASGGLATVHIENSHMSGDICSVHPDSAWFTDIFSIECKTGYPTTSFWQHFTKVKFNIEDFWLQSVDDAKKANKQPMLIYRKKGRRWIVGINKQVDNALKEHLHHFNSIEIKWGGIMGNDIYECVLYDMDDFFLIHPQIIRKILCRL